MPGLMGRASTIVKAKLSKLLDRAEDPSETLDYSYEEQLRQLQNVKRGIADVTTAKKRLEMQYTSMQQQAEKLDGQARQALQSGREDLAREALTRKAALEAQLGAIMEQGRQLEAQQQKLISGEKTLRAKDKTEQMQARAGAIEELTEAGALEDFTGGGDDIDRQLAQLGQGAQVDDELAKMKAELGTGGDKKQLEGGE